MNNLNPTHPQGEESLGHPNQEVQESENVNLPAKRQVGRKPGVSTRRLSDIELEILKSDVITQICEYALAPMSLINYLMNHSITCTKAQAQRVIDAANEELAEIYSDRNLVTVETSLRDLLKLYELAFRTKDLRLCLDIRRDINKVAGLQGIATLDATDIPSIIKLIEVRNEGTAE